MAASDLKIKDILARDLRHKIEPVVKVYDRAHLAEDLRQFVITDSLARELCKFLDDFAESVRTRVRGGKASDGMALWLWGFFGSGKSHVAKVLGHLLEDDVVEEDGNKKAIDLFNLHLDDPTLPRALELKAVLAEVRNHAWCKLIPFEIKAKLDQANPESVTEACLRSFYESLGLASTIWLARLERKLQSEDRHQEFLQAYGDKTGRHWSEDRPEHGFYEDEISAALAASVGRSEDSARQMIETYKRDHSRVSPEILARELAAYLQHQTDVVKPREPHVIFVIDEMGQFVADSSDRIHELQSIIETTGAEGRGRIWFVCTSQEALDQVVERTGLRLSGLGKLDARFSVKIPLTSEDVRRVVQDRLLRKLETEKVQRALDKLWTRAEGHIEDLSRLPIEKRLAHLDRTSFAASYPFLPYTIPLVQELFNAIRGFKLSGSERSMIDQAQGALRFLADQSLGAIVPLDLIFDQVVDELSFSDYLGTAGMKVIREVDYQVPGTPIPPNRVLKALWLVSRVEWIPRTPDVLARLLAERIDADLAQLKRDVEETLNRLQKAGLVGKDEATGQYRYLSEEERGVEEDIVEKIRDYGIGVAKRKAAELLKKHLMTRSKWGDYKAGLGKSGVIPFSLYFDEEVITSNGEIEVRVYSPLSDPKVEDIERANLAAGTKGRTLWWIAAEDNTLVDKLKRLEALEKVPQSSKWRHDRSDETERVLKEKEKERSALESRLVQALEKALLQGRLYYSGEAAELDGSKDLKSVAGEFVGAVASHLYTRFPIADKEFDEKNIPNYLKPSVKAIDRLDPELGLFDAQGQLIRNSPLVETIFEELERRKDEALDLDGKALLGHFQKIAFGWPDALVRLVLAAMLRGGAIYLEPADSDRPIYDVTEPDIEKIFTGSQKFRKTRFFPTTGGLTATEVKQAKETLISLGESGLPDTAHGLAERIRKLAERYQREGNTVRQRVEDLRLPLPDTYRKAAATAKSAMESHDPVTRVRTFLEQQDSWKELSDFLDAYAEFVEHKRDESYRTYRSLLEYARNSLNIFDGKEGDLARRALDEFDAIVKAKEVLPKWKTVQESALGIIDRYRNLYRQELKECANAIRNLRDEIEASQAFRRLDESPRRQIMDTYFGPASTLSVSADVKLDSPNDLLRASERRKMSELSALCMGLPGYRPTIFEQCDREWIKQETEKGKEVKKDKIYRFKLRERLAGRTFVKAEEFEEEWKAMADEIKDLLDEGFEVVIE